MSEMSHLAVRGGVALLAAASLGSLAPGAAQAAETPARVASPHLAEMAGPGITGISDQRLQDLTPAEQAFTAELHPKNARLVVSPDVMRRPDELAKTDAWLAATGRMGLKPTISLGFPVGLTDSPKVPTVSTYRRDAAAFVRAHPTVRQYTAFNEANHYPDKISPSRAAKYYQALSDICLKRCVVVAADFNLGVGTAGYLTAYRKDLEKQGEHPTTWAVHPGEGAVRLTTIRRILPKKHQLLYTEAALMVGPDQAKDAAALVTMSRKRDVVGTNVYQMSSRGVVNPNWDAGLISETGQPTPAFGILAAAATSTATPPAPRPARAPARPPSRVGNTKR